MCRGVYKLANKLAYSAQREKLVVASRFIYGADWEKKWWSKGDIVNIEIRRQAS